jgi:hypothetical protein
MKKFLTWVALLVTMLGFGLNAQPVVIDDSGTAEVRDTSILPRKNIRPQGLPVKRTSPVFGKTTAQWGPRVNDPGYDLFAKDVIETLRTNGIPKSQIGGKLLPGYLIGNPERNTIWFTTEFSSDEAFVVDEMQCEIESIPTNLLGKIEIIKNVQNIYSVTSVGEVWNADGTKRVISSGTWNSQPVNRFIFLGVASKRFSENSDAQVVSDTAWLLAFPNFTLVGKWSILLDGNLVASDKKVLETNPASVIMGGLMISPVAGQKNMYTIQLPKFSGVGALQYSEALGGRWTTINGFTLISGSKVGVSSADALFGYFRLLVE